MNFFFWGGILRSGVRIHSFVGCKIYSSRVLNAKINCPTLIWQWQHQERAKYTVNTCRISVYHENWTSAQLRFCIISPSIEGAKVNTCRISVYHENWIMAQLRFCIISASIKGAKVNTCQISVYHENWIMAQQRFCIISASIEGGQCKHLSD